MKIILSIKNENSVTYKLKTYDTIEAEEQRITLSNENEDGMILLFENKEMTEKALITLLNEETVPIWFLHPAVILTPREAIQMKAFMDAKGITLAGLTPTEKVEKQIKIYNKWQSFLISRTEQTPREQIPKKEQQGPGQAKKMQARPKENRTLKTKTNTAAMRSPI